MSDNPNDTTCLEHREIDWRSSTTEGIDLVMKEHLLDALLFQNNRGASKSVRVSYPSITEPAGYTEDGHSVGVTFSTQSLSEARLIEFAYSHE